MDISVMLGDTKFNYRVCGVMISDGKILAMRDENAPYYYLPGGRVMVGETAEQAVLRELSEELCVTAEIIRPLWLNQSFFTEKVDYHELCIYFLMDISKTDLLSRGERFTLKEGRHTLDLEWLRFERLKVEDFVPHFLKESIFELPKEFTLHTEDELHRMPEE